MDLITITGAFGQAGASFHFAPFATILQPLIEQTLTEQGKDQCRKGVTLVPTLLVWLVLALTIRRDLNYHKVLNWMLSGFRWIQSSLPAKSKIVQDGTISHARVRIGVEVFRLLLAKLVASFKTIEADFHGRVTVIFDGSTGTMPDTQPNEEKFHKPKSGKGKGAFPQLRMVTLLALSPRFVLDVAFAPFSGKKTGERTLMQEILGRLVRKNLLFLLDAGLYSFKMIWGICQREQDLIVKVPKTVKLKLTKILPDGSFLAQVSGKIKDLDAPKTKDGRQRWKKVSLTLRIIRVDIPGFRPFRLMTNILDPDITARELVLHYHERWDIEISYDEIKTHQCATLRGQSPTTFRSKRPDLVEQELYAVLIMYNLVRLLIFQAAVEHGKDPRFISFLDALQHIIDAAPIMTVDEAGRSEVKFNYLLAMIADCDIDRPRRHRISPRVVKVRVSKFKRKNEKHKSENRDIEKELKIIPPGPNALYCSNLLQT